MPVSTPKVTVTGVSMRTRVPGCVREDIGRVSEDTGCVSKDTGCISEDTGCISKDTERVSKDTGRVREDMSCVRENTGRVREEMGGVSKDRSMRDVVSLPSDFCHHRCIGQMCTSDRGSELVIHPIPTVL
jgi:hypothetical protein